MQLETFCSQHSTNPHNPPPNSRLLIQPLQLLRRALDRRARAARFVFLPLAALKAPVCIFGGGEGGRGDGGFGLGCGACLGCSPPGFGAWLRGGGGGILVGKGGEVGGGVGGRRRGESGGGGGIDGGGGNPWPNCGVGGGCSRGVGLFFGGALGLWGL